MHLRIPKLKKGWSRWSACDRQIIVTILEVNQLGKLDSLWFADVQCAWLLAPGAVELIDSCDNCGTNPSSIYNGPLPKRIDGHALFAASWNAYVDITFDASPNDASALVELRLDEC